MRHDICMIDDNEARQESVYTCAPDAAPTLKRVSAIVYTRETEHCFRRYLRGPF